MSDFEKCKKEYKDARNLYWSDKAGMKWAIKCWESAWPQTLREQVKQSLSWN